MSLAVSPELEARLKARADEDGLPLEVYLEQLLRDEESAIVHMEGLLREATTSGTYIELTGAEWDQMEREAGVVSKSPRCAKSGLLICAG